MNNFEPIKKTCRYSSEELYDIHQRKKTAKNKRKAYKQSHLSKRDYF